MGIMGLLVKTVSITMAPNETPSWATKAPYAPPANDFDIKLQGSCHCGHVMYNLSRDKPLASKFCHCNDCKIIHGAPFQWATVFEKEDLSFPPRHRRVEVLQLVFP